MARRLRADAPPSLSPRELQLLKLAARGLTDQAIANELGISLATIATYWGRIRIKFGPLNRTEIVAQYLQAQSEDAVEILENEISLLRGQIDKGDNVGVETLYLNKIPDSVMVLNDRGMILYVNEATCTLLGYSPDEFQGKTLLDFYAEERHDRWGNWFQEYLVHPNDPALNTDRPAFVRHKNGDLGVYRCNLNMFLYEGEARIVIVSRPES